MNPTVRKTLIAIVVLAFLAVLIMSFQKNFEYVEQTEWKPLTGEARTNPLYASKLFLRRMGIPTEMVESLQNLTTLPDTDGAILISSSRQTLQEAQFMKLLEWTKNGGHLILSGIVDWGNFMGNSPLVDEPDNADDEEDVFTPSSDNDAFQEFLDVHLHEAILFEKDKFKMITPEGADHSLALGTDYYRSIVLNDPSATKGLEQVSIGEYNFMLRQRVDAGLITLVSNFDFIDNYKLGKHDHAEILWEIVTGKAAAQSQKALSLPSTIWLIHSDETASLFELIWKNFWALVITLALLFLLWVMRVSRRFGPLIPKETEDRRNLLEHIDASGAYYWKQQNHSELLESTRNAAQQQLAKRIPGWHALTQQDQIQLLAKRLNIKEQSLAKSLYGSISARPHEFTETVKQLEYIRTHL